MSKDDLFREWKEENGAGSPLTLTHGLTRRQCLLFSLAGATELMLSGCGGGGGSASGGTGAVTGSLISGDQRAAVLTGVSTFFSQLPHTSVQDDNQKLVAYLSGNGKLCRCGVAKSRFGMGALQGRHAADPRERRQRHRSGCERYGGPCQSLRPFRPVGKQSCRRSRDRTADRSEHLPGQLHRSLCDLYSAHAGGAERLYVRGCAGPPSMHSPPN